MKSLESRANSIVDCYKNGRLFIDDLVRILLFRTGGGLTSVVMKALDPVTRSKCLSELEEIANSAPCYFYSNLGTIMVKLETRNEFLEWIQKCKLGSIDYIELEVVGPPDDEIHDRG